MNLKQSKQLRFLKDSKGSFAEVHKVRSFEEDSYTNLVSFKIVVLSIQIKTKNTTILKETRFAQLAS